MLVGGERRGNLGEERGAGRGTGMVMGEELFFPGG